MISFLSTSCHIKKFAGNICLVTSKSALLAMRPRKTCRGTMSKLHLDRKTDEKFLDNSDQKHTLNSVFTFLYSGSISFN